MSVEGTQLSKVNVLVEIVDATAKVTLKQQFENTSQGAPAEVSYVLDLSKLGTSTSAAVCSFIATLSNGKVVHATIQEKETAAKHYDDALASGHDAFLLEHTSNDGQEIFTCNIGKLDSGTTITTEVSFVIELEAVHNSVSGEMKEDGQIRFSLPALPKMRSDAVEEIVLKVDSHVPIKGFSSISHPQMVFTQRGGKESQLQVFESAVTADQCGTEVIICMNITNPHSPGGFYEQLPTGGVSALVFFEPKIEGPELSPGEIFFLLDRSGSMSGASIQRACETLQLFLRSIPLGSLFNIVGFGSSYDAMFTTSQEYTDGNLSQACEKVSKIQADLGGTNLLPALNFVFSEKRKKISLPRLIFILTDGDIDDQELVIASVMEHSYDTRVFTIGITGSNPPSLKRISDSGKGETEIVHSKEEMTGVVIRQLKRSLAPSLVSPHVDWGKLQEFLVFQEPPGSDFLFFGERILVYAMFKEGSEVILKSNPNVTFSASNMSSLIVPLCKAHQDSLSIQTLCAWKHVKTLEKTKSNDMAKIKSEIISLCKRFSFASKYASFVAVEERQDATISTPIRVELPIIRAKPPQQTPSASSSFSSSSGGIMRLFGKKKPAVPSPSVQIQTLRDTADILQRRQDFLQRRAEESQQHAKQAIAKGNKRLAIQELKRKKLLELQTEEISQRQMGLEQSIMQLECATSCSEHCALASTRSSLSVDQIDGIIDSIQEKMDVSNEISQALNVPMIDENEINEELTALVEENEYVDTAQQTTTTTTTKLSAVPATTLTTTTEGDELAELERAMDINNSTTSTSQQTIPRIAISQPTIPIKHVEPIIQIVSQPIMQTNAKSVDSLIALQHVSGNWDWSEKVIEFFVKDKAETLALLLKTIENDIIHKKLEIQDYNSLLATVLVVAFIKVNYVERSKGDLELILKKSMNWIDDYLQKLGQSQLNSSILVEIATKLI